MNIMNKTIIGIYGRADEGKSKTIKNVCKLLIELFPIAKPSIKDINYKNFNLSEKYFVYFDLI